MTAWNRLMSHTDEVVPPEEVKVRALDVLPYRWGVWCTVGDSTKPFANGIVSRKWSEDGQHIWFMLDSHNFLKAEPDEILELVALDPSGWLSGELLAKRDAEDASFESKRPRKSPVDQPTHFRLAQLLLDRSADLVSNQGCNDLHLVDDVGLTPHQSMAVRQAIHAWNKDAGAPAPRPSDHLTQDWLVMRYLVSVFQEYEKQTLSQGKP